MDFQTRLYELDEINSCLYDIGFTKLSVYSSYEKVSPKIIRRKNFCMNVLFNDFKYDKEIKTLSKIKVFCYCRN